MSDFTYELAGAPADCRWLLAELGQRGVADFALHGGHRLVRVGSNGRLIEFNAGAADLVAALATRYLITRRNREVLFPLAVARLVLKRLHEAPHLKPLHEHELRRAA